MNKVFFVSGVMLFSVMMLAGCAKQELVKKEDQVTVTPQAKEAIKQDPAKSSVKEEQIASTSIKEAALGRDEAAASSSRLSEEKDKLFDSIYFDFDSSLLSESSRQALTKNAELVLKKKPNVKVQIEGHCDERGSSEYNMALGERRAKSAAAYLITLGISADRISTISYGKERPAVLGSGEEVWSKNRRDDFVIVK